jgi:alpha-L-fucosidase 2
VSADGAFHTLTPAPTWEDGLITGSGRVGALVFGAADALRVTVAHERFFLPANPRPPAPDLRPALPSMRAALADGDADAAAAAFADALTADGFDGLVWTDPLGLCATLTVRAREPLHQTHRTIDPRRGVVGVHGAAPGGGAVRVHAVAPRGHDTVWLALSAEEPATFDLVLSLEADDTPAASFAPDYTGAVTASGEAGQPARLVVRGADGAPLAVTTASGSWRQQDAGAVRRTVHVDAATPLLLRLDVAVTGHESRPAPDATWLHVLAEQTAAHRTLVDAATLSLHATADDHLVALPVEELWARVRAGDDAALRRATEIAYLSGRAHTIAGTGELPPTLQGVWQGTFTPAWSADYTLNGNVQNGTLAPLIPTGTPELVSSLLELVLPHVADYRANARRLYAADGMLLPSRMSTHGAADHANGDFPHVFWIGCGGWVLRVAADLVATTGDRDVVDDRLWELAEGVLRFAETALVRDDAGGRHVRPSYSPENTPAGAATPLAADSTVDIAVLRDAARATALLGAARGDASLDARWQRIVAELPPYRVADDGTLAEWISPGYAEQIAHRHASQLYPLWYDPDAAFRGDSAGARALRSAARESVRRKLAWRQAQPGPPPGRGEMAFGLAQLGLAAAALGDAASAAACVRILVRDHWQPALTTTHDAGRIFNLDAAGALPAVVAAMLVGSSVGELRLLPALPAEWPRGEATGLRARGGVVLERLRWDERVVEAEVRVLPGAAWLNPGGRVRVTVGGGYVLAGQPEIVLSRRMRLRAQRP